MMVCESDSFCGDRRRREGRANKDCWWIGSEWWVGWGGCEVRGKSSLTPWCVFVFWSKDGVNINWDGGDCERLLCGKIKWTYLFEKSIKYLSEMPRKYLSV